MFTDDPHRFRHPQPRKVKDPRTRKVTRQHVNKHGFMIVKRCKPPRRVRVHRTKSKGGDVWRALDPFDFKTAYED